MKNNRQWNLLHQYTCQTWASWILPLLLLAVPAAVDAQFRYVTNNGAITITGYDGYGGAVIIPSTINGLPVVEIGGSAFYLCTGLTSVTIPLTVTNIGNGAFRTYVTPVLIAINVDSFNLTYSSVGGVLCDKSQRTLIGYPGGRAGSYAIPNSVTSIGEQAFYKSPGLTSVTIPDSVTNIGNSAFEFCTRLSNVLIGNGVRSIGSYAFTHSGLTSMTIPRSVTNLAHAAFLHAEGLTVITVDGLNPVYSSLGGVLFDKDQTTLILYPEGKAGVYNIPNSVTSIGPGGFVLCGRLTSVTIPSSVTGIGNNAYYECTALTSVYFRGNAPSIGSSVFDGALQAMVYYLPGTIGWGTTFGDRPTAQWQLPNPLILSQGPRFGVQSNRFGFIISWAAHTYVVVETCTNLANPVWSPGRTSTLTDGWSYVSDADWANYPARFYRLRWP